MIMKNKKKTGSRRVVLSRPTRAVLTMLQRCKEPLSLGGMLHALDAMGKKVSLGEVVIAIEYLKENKLLEPVSISSHREAAMALRRVVKMAESLLIETACRVESKARFQLTSRGRAR